MTFQAGSDSAIPGCNSVAPAAIRAYPNFPHFMFTSAPAPNSRRSASNFWPSYAANACKALPYSPPCALGSAPASSSMSKASKSPNTAATCNIPAPCGLRIFGSAPSCSSFSTRATSPRVSATYNSGRGSLLTGVDDWADVFETNSSSDPRLGWLIATRFEDV